MADSTTLPSLVTEWSASIARLGILPDQSHPREFERVNFDIKHDKAPAGAGALLRLFNCIDELPSATGRQNDRFALRKQFLAQVPFAV